MAGSRGGSQLVPRTGPKTLHGGINIVNKQAISTNKLNPDVISGF